MLMCLSSLGALLAEALQCTYMRICCQLHQQQQQRSAGSGEEEKRTMTKRRHAAGNGVSQTVRMIDIIYAAAATAVANLNSLSLSSHSFSLAETLSC